MYHCYNIRATETCYNRCISVLSTSETKPSIPICLGGRLDGRPPVSHAIYKWQSHCTVRAFYCQGLPVGEFMPRCFHTKLRHLRHRQSITQAQLAGQLGLTSHTHISHLESGRKSPSLDLVLRVARYFGVTTDYLLRDSIPVATDTEQTAAYAEREAMFPQLFSAKLRHLRKQQGMTQEDLARQISSWTQAHISLLERGGSEPSIELVLQLADLFQVTTNYLLNDTIPVE